MMDAWDMREMYVRQGNRKKAEKFGKALESYERYRDWCKQMLKDGKLTQEEYDTRLSHRAKMLDL